MWKAAVQQFFGHTDAARLSTLAMSEQLQSLTAGSLGDVPWGLKKHMAIGNPLLWENQVPISLQYIYNILYILHIYNSVFFSIVMFN